MIDKDITIKRLEDLIREVSRIEFSHEFSAEVVESAIKSRMELETLVSGLRSVASE